MSSGLLWMRYWSEYRSLMAESKSVDLEAGNTSSPTEGENTEGKSKMPPRLNVKTHRFPYCIVWTPLPLLS